ncbi:MAG: methyltransferase [Enterovibrio sp.]
MQGSQRHFQLLDQYLSHHQHFWQNRPFEWQKLPWWHSHFQLCQWLSSLDAAQLAQLKEAPQALCEIVQTWLPEVANFTTLCQVMPAPCNGLQAPTSLQEGIAFRKWQQIDAFNRAIPLFPHSNTTTWLDWCAGKGHLSRVVSATRAQAITCLEWQSALCDDGAKIAQKLQLALTFVQEDAFSPAAAAQLNAASDVVALHACGQLHIRLLQLLAAQNARVALAPCCYHLIDGDFYQPLSSLGKASLLRLSRHDLKLPLQETVTAPNNVKKRRVTEISFRLGFDCLQKQLRGTDSYLPLPNVQKSILDKGFGYFCQWAAQAKGVTLPNNVAFDEFLRQGEARFVLVEQMETLRTLFRRPLELWLALDKVLYMQEKGFKAQLWQFCPRELTPRNLLIYCEK